jgi:hypothetical protein
MNVSGDWHVKWYKVYGCLRYDIREERSSLSRQKSHKSADAVTPVWFELPRRFYERLAAAQKEFSIPRAKLLMRGLELAIKEQQAKHFPAKPSKSDDANLSDALRRVAEKRWQTASEEERKAVGQKLAAARWAKKQTKKSGKTEAS